MNSSDSAYDIADEIWGSVEGIQPAGSAGDLLGGVLKIPAAILYFLGDVLWDFGS